MPPVAHRRRLSVFGAEFCDRLSASRDRVPVADRAAAVRAGGAGVRSADARVDAAARVFRGALDVAPHAPVGGRHAGPVVPVLGRRSDVAAIQPLFADASVCGGGVCRVSNDPERHLFGHRARQAAYRRSDRVMAGVYSSRADGCDRRRRGARRLR